MAARIKELEGMVGMDYDVVRSVTRLRKRRAFFSFL
jgi:hypothetical protein